MTTKHRAEELAECLLFTKVAKKYVSNQLEAVKLLRTIPALEAEIERLKLANQPDLFWDADDGDCSGDSINNVIVYAIECGAVEEGGIMNIGIATTLPDIQVRVTKLEGKDGFPEWELIK